MLPNGYLLDGRFMIEHPLGQGGMAAVYRAQHLELDGEAVALKMIRADLRDRPGFEERFRREAKAARRVVHPNVVAVREFGVSREGDLYLVMDLVEGQTLQQLIREGEGALPLERVGEIVADVASALDAMHAAGVVHRDLKPDNVMVATTGEVKVLDFGIARAVGDQTITTPGDLVGSSEYVAPEQILGQQASARSDQYLLGLLAYEVLCGQRPYSGTRGGDYIVQHVQGTPTPVRAHRQGVPEGVDAVFARALAKGPEARYPSAGALAEGFGAALRGAGDAGGGWFRRLWSGS